MKRLLALLALLLASPAVAQTPGTFTSGSTLGAAALNSALASKTDATLGVPYIQGADATGLIDNSAVFTTALATHRTVRVPAGTYGFSNKMVAPAGVSEIICDKGATLVALPGNVANALFLSTPATVTRMSIKGCAFDGRSATVGVNTLFFQIFQSANVVFDDCYFTDNRWHLAAFSATTGSGIRNSRFINVGNYGKGTSNYPLTVTVTYNTSGNGNFFDHNYAFNIGGDAIDAGTQTNFSARGNTIIGDNRGFVSPTSAAGTGLYVFGSPSVVANPETVGAIIADNLIYGLTGNGIDLNCLSNASATGNASLHNGGAGIALSGIDPGGNICTSDRVTITGNTLNNNYQAAAGMATLATSALTAAGSPVLTFVDTTGVVNGMKVYDASGGVPLGTAVLSHDATTVTLDANTVGGGVASAASIVFLNYFPRPPAPNGGLWLGCAGGIACTSDSLVVAANVATDNQSTKTQPYGISQSSLLTITNSKISADNAVTGNATANTIRALLMDQGSGSNAWACWPGSSLTASGAFGSMACGFSAVASGAGALAMGTGLTASGTYSHVTGKDANDRGMLGKQCYGSGFLAASGDAQTCVSVMRGTGATGSAFRLTTSGAVAGGTNCVSPPNNSAFALIVTVTAFDHTTVGNNEIWPAWTGLMTRGANAASTALTMNTTPTPLTNGTVGGSAIAATADTTNGCLNISFTPPTANTDTWNVVARVESVEVQ